jgi:hypothetical protein
MAENTHYLGGHSDFYQALKKLMPQFDANMLDQIDRLHAEYAQVDRKEINERELKIQLKMMYLQDELTRLGSQGNESTKIKSM